MLSTPASSYVVESRRGAQHTSVTFTMPFDPGHPIPRLECRLPNLYFSQHDIIRLQTFLEVEFRVVSNMANPSPDFLFSRLVTALHTYGRVNMQCSVDVEDEWKFFLTDRDRQDICDLEAREKEVFVSSRDGLGVYSDLEVKAFYRGFHDKFAAWRKKVSDQMWESFRTVQNDQTETWKLLKRIRGTSRAVPIEPGKLLEHFRSIFFRADRPLSIQYPALHHQPVYGPFLREDYLLSADFTISELQTAVDNLNQAAGVGPG